MSIPDEGLSLPLLIDELSACPTIGSLNHPPRRQRLINTLTQTAALIKLTPNTITRTQLLNTIQTYGQHLLEHPYTTELRNSSKLMPPPLLRPLLAAVECPATVWSNTATKKGPFHTRWLTLLNPHRSTPHISINELLMLSRKGQRHIGQEGHSPLHHS